MNARAIFLAVVVALLAAGCGEKPATPPPATVEAANADTQVKCVRCGATFNLGDAKRPNPHAPQVICPACGEAILPKPAND